MAEMRGYTCDGKCGNTTVTTKVTESIRDHGWLTIFTPEGFPTLHVCSFACGVRTLETYKEDRQLAR